MLYIFGIKDMKKLMQFTLNINAINQCKEISGLFQIYFQFILNDWVNLMSDLLFDNY